MDVLKKNKETRIYKLTGVSLILMAIIAGYSYGFVLSDIYVKGNVAATLMNIEAKGIHYLTGIIGWGLILLLDILIAYNVYGIFGKAHKKIAGLSAGLRLIYSVFLGIGIMALIQKNIPAFMAWWDMGLVIFGLHLVGLYVLNNHYYKVAPKWIGYLLLIAGIGYSFVHGVYAFMPSMAEGIKPVEQVLILPMSLSELLLALWLLRRREA